MTYHKELFYLEFIRTRIFSTLLKNKFRPTVWIAQLPNFVLSYLFIYIFNLIVYLLCQKRIEMASEVTNPRTTPSHPSTSEMFNKAMKRIKCHHPQLKLNRRCIKVSRNTSHLITKSMLKNSKYFKLLRCCIRKVFLCHLLTVLYHQIDIECVYLRSMI